MVYAVCIGKRKENNVIVEYKLKDFTNKTIVVGSEELKQFIKNGKIVVVNLTLTSNNKLVDSGIKDLDSLQKKEKVVKTREENISSILEQNDPVDIANNENTFIYGGKMFFVDKHNMLCVIDVSKNLNKGLCEKVLFVAYIPKNNTMNIFVIYEHMDRRRLKRLCYDMVEDRLSLSYQLWFLDDDAVIGRQAKMTNVGFDKVVERPEYYVGNYKSQYDYAILPIKKKTDNGYVIIDIVICDFVREHFYRGKSETRWFEDFVNVLNENNYFVIPFSTLSNTGSKIIIQTSKMVVILIYEGSRVEFYKE